MLALHLRRIGGISRWFIDCQLQLDDLVSNGYLSYGRKNTHTSFLGGGSNVLVSDAGVRGIVILNKAREVVFNEESEPPTVWAASGSNFGQVARQAGLRGLGGLEWAAGIPGTIGGAVLGNAGAHGGDVAGNLLVAEILHREIEDKRSKNGNPPSMLVEREHWKSGKTGLLLSFKSHQRSAAWEIIIPVRICNTGAVADRSQPSIVILAALMQLAHSKREAVEALIE